MKFELKIIFMIVISYNFDFESLHLWNAERQEQNETADTGRAQARSPNDSWKRMGDIRKHFFDSGFSDQGKNPELQVYTNFKTRVGAEWVIEYTLL